MRGSLFTRSQADLAPSSCCIPFGRKNGSTKVQTPVSVDRDLAKEMYELSVAERERLMDDIHGVAPVIEETPDFVNKSLQEFDEALAKIPIKKRQNVTRAFFLRPKLETDTGLRLMFLRAENFEPHEAAQRMVRFFDAKSVLFGPDKLVKTITINDLSETDVQVLDECPTAVLPFKDQSGRPIMFGNGTRIDLGRFPMESFLRCVWYNACTTISDESAQKTGLCFVVYSSRTRSAVAGMGGKAAEFISQGGSVVDSLPCRFSSYHWCYDSPGINVAVNAMRLAFGKSSRLRLKAHFGSEIENEYKLMSFGIHAEGLFQGALNGDIVYLRDYVAHRRAIDSKIEQAEKEKEAATGIIEYPKPNDVLFGRGQPYREFSGNLDMYKLVDSELENYIKCPGRFEKTCFTMNLVKNMQDDKVRFLERLESGWRVVDDTVAREKMAITFRSRVRALALGKKTVQRSPPPPFFKKTFDNNNHNNSNNNKRARYDTGPTVIDVIPVSGM